MPEGAEPSGAAATERELVDRARSGNEAACRALVEACEDSVAAVVIGMLGPGDDADDVGQETFIRFFRSLHRFRGDSSVRTYLQRIAMNLSINALRRRQRGVRRFFSLDDAGESHAALQVTAGSLHESGDARDQVHAALALLPAAQRSVVVLRMIEGHSTRETATLLGIAEGTVLSRLARGMERLRGILRDA